MQKIKNMIASLGRVVENVNLYVNKDQLKGLNKKIVRAIKEIPVKGRANYAKRMYEKVNVYDLRIKNLEMILLEKSKEINKANVMLKFTRLNNVYLSFVVVVATFFVSLFDDQL